MKTVFCTPFTNKEQRNFLIDRFNLFLDRLHELEIEFECWINGSFTTHKEEPNDIDAVFFFNPDDIKKLTGEKSNLIKELFNNPTTKARYRCDVYFQVNNDDAYRSYWRGWFGYSRTEQPKGIARIIR